MQKQVSPLDDDDITESRKNVMVVQSGNCTKNCTGVRALAIRPSLNKMSDKT